MRGLVCRKANRKSQFFSALWKVAVNLSVSSHLKVQNTLLQFNKSLYTGKDTSRIASHVADPVNENMVVIALYREIMAAVLLFIL